MKKNPRESRGKKGSISKNMIWKNKVASLGSTENTRIHQFFTIRNEWEKNSKQIEGWFGWRINGELDLHSSPTKPTVVSAIHLLLTISWLNGYHQ